MRAYPSNAHLLRSSTNAVCLLAFGLCLTAITSACYGQQAEVKKGADHHDSADLAPIGVDDDATAAVTAYWEWLKHRDGLTLAEVDRFLGYEEGETRMRLPLRWQAVLVYFLATDPEFDRTELNKSVLIPQNAKRLGFIQKDEEVSIVEVAEEQNGDFPRTTAPFKIKHTVGEWFIESPNGQAVDIQHLIWLYPTDEWQPKDVFHVCFGKQCCFLAIHNRDIAPFAIYKLSVPTGTVEWESTVHRAISKPQARLFIPDRLKMELVCTARSVGVFYSSAVAYSIEIIDAKSGANRIRIDLFKYDQEVDK